MPSSRGSSQLRDQTQFSCTAGRFFIIKPPGKRTSLYYTKHKAILLLYNYLWESDTTERLHFHFSLSCTGEGNGNPLQCSCLENPRDGGAWWAAVYGVAHVWTRLKQLSSSSSNYLFLQSSLWKYHSWDALIGLKAALYFCKYVKNKQLFGTLQNHDDEIQDIHMSYVAICPMCVMPHYKVCLYS